MIPASLQYRLNYMKEQLLQKNHPGRSSSKAYQKHIEKPKILGSALPMLFSVGINRYPVCDRWWRYVWAPHARQLLGILRRWASSCCHSVGEWPCIGLHGPCRQRGAQGTQLIWAVIHRGAMPWDNYRKTTKQAMIVESALTKVNRPVIFEAQISTQRDHLERARIQKNETHLEWLTLWTSSVVLK